MTVLFPDASPGGRSSGRSSSSSSSSSSNSSSSQPTVIGTGSDREGNPVYWTSGGTRHEGTPPSSSSGGSSSSSSGGSSSSSSGGSSSSSSGGSSSSSTSPTTTSRSAAQRAAENIQASNRKEFEQQLRAQYGSRVGEITRSSGEKEYYVDGRLSAEYNPEGQRVLTTGTYTNPKTGKKQSVRSDRTSLQQSGVSRTREYEEAVAE